MSKQQKQIADLILGHIPGAQVSSELQSGTGFGQDVEHRFEISDGVERYGVVIILAKLRTKEQA